MDEVAARFLVSGRVQGVYFRGATREQALALGIGGHARNLPDGRVEVVAAGTPEALTQLDQWLHEGPPAARVDEVQREAWSDEVPAGFAIA